jgi:DNA-binding beta-propeller fold protein YncE
VTRVGVVALLAALVAVSAGPGSVEAFDSRCYLPNGDKCPDGLAAARNRWLGPSDEHRAIWALAASAQVGALPESLAKPFDLLSYSLDDEVPSAPTYESWAPLLAGVEEQRRRRVTIAEMTQLPDFSWSLWDWALANEVCPNYTNTNPPTTPADCHNYETHMGALNSNHMAPQNRLWYEHYHQLALDRARACAATVAWISGQDPGALGRFEKFLFACEKEAMLLEAVAHHFLQDAWSSGHMWERWGSTELSDFGDDRNVAMAIALYVGLLHGSKAVFGDITDWLIANFGWDPAWTTADDPLCAPHPLVAYIDDDPGPDGDPYELGAGDLFWEDTLAPLVGDYTDQKAALLGCSVSGMREVYGETAKLHGPMGTPSSVQADLTRDVYGDECWLQRVTNGAMMLGFGLHVGPTPLQVRVIGPWNDLVPGSSPPVGSGALPLGALSAASVSTVIAKYTGNAPLTALQTARFQFDSARVAALLIARGTWPGSVNDTDLASGGMPSIMGIGPGSQYARGGGGNTANLPGSVADPSFPWVIADTSPDAFKRRALNLAFADSHAPDRCDSFSSADLAGYRAASTVAIAAGTPDAGALCGLCSQMVEPFLRIGIGFTDYDAAREPLCSYLVGGGADVVYTGTYAVPGSASGAARQYCGCGRLLALSSDPWSAGLSVWSATGTVLEPDPVNVSAPGEMLPTDGGARDMAFAGPQGEWAFVTTANGWLHVFETAVSTERELDADDDPATTTAGAPNGVTRIFLGDEPRGIVTLNQHPIAIVAIEAGLVVIDTDQLVVLANIPGATLGIASNERPFDIAVTPNDTKAYVTLYRPPGFDPSPFPNRVLVLDLADFIANQVTVATVLTSINTGAETNNQAIAMSHAGDKVAVACVRTNRIAIIDTATDDLWDIDPLTPFTNGQFYVPEVFLPSEAPSALVWAPDDSAVYAGYLTGPAGSSIEGNGTVRKCVIGNPWCWHAVAVEGPVRSLAVDRTGSVVWVSDGSGWITPIQESLFVPDGPSILGFPTTSGRNGVGDYDGTGGCLVPFSGWYRAVPCEPAGCLLTPANLAGRGACVTAGQNASFQLSASAIVVY